MALTTVRVFDFDTRQVTTIPASELASGMILARVQGIEGQVFVNAAQGKEGRFCHPPFPDPVRELLVQMHLDLNLVGAPHETLQELEDSFRQDTNPDKEISLWLVMIGACKRFAAMRPATARPLDDDQKRDILNVVLAFVNNGADNVLATTTHRTISRSRVKEMVAWCKENLPTLREEALKRVFSLFPPVVPITVGFGMRNAKVPTLDVAALMDGSSINFPVRRALHYANVVLAIDNDDILAVYGLDVLARIRDGSKKDGARIIAVRLCPGLDSGLDLLAAVVQVIKGHCDLI
jgi:hypothetical protein